MRNLRAIPRARLAHAVVAVAIPLAIALLAWPAPALEPAAGLDFSWIAGISMAVHNGVSFGNHAIFTYGPLGFLTVQSVWYGGLGAGSFAYLLIVRLGLAALLFASLRRTFGGVAAFVIAVLVAQFAWNQAETVLVLIALVLAATSGLADRQLIAVAAGAGALAGIELLAKLSVAPSICAMTAIFVVTVRGRRRDLVAAAALSGLAVFLIGWFVTGQPLSAMPDYISNEIQIASGYASAMSTSTASAGWQLPAAVVAFAFGLWGALHMTETGASRQRWCVVLLWVVFWFFAFKEGFVRRDLGHTIVFFSAILGGFAALRWRWTHRAAALACWSALLIFALVANKRTFGSLIHPVANVRHAVHEARDFASPNSLIETGRKQIKAILPLDPRLLGLLAGHSVTPYPYELALAWAYGLNWDPVPVLQSYSAYTSRLDNVDARFLRSHHAPQRILLRSEPGIDDRLVQFDQGETNRTMLCRYREAGAAGLFAVLELGSNRCSSPSLLQTVRAGWGQSVQVPSPPDGHSLVFVRVSGVQVSGLERLRALFYKPSDRFVLVNGRRFRLVEGTAGDGLPLLASPGYDYSQPYSFAAGAKTIAVQKQGQGATRSRPIRFDFYVQRFSERVQPR